MILSDYISISIESVCKKHDWLIRLTEPLFELYSECKNIEEVTLINELLERFMMIEDDERYIGYEGMADYIKSIFEPDKTLIVAMTKSHEPDSGQKVLAELRTFLIEKGVKAHNFLNRFDNLSPIKHKKFSKVIIVDEFMGSGKTVKNRFEDIHKLLPHVTDAHCCLLAGMKTTLNDINAALVNGDSIYCHYQLTKGILGHYSGESLIEKTKTMLKIEHRLSDSIGKKLLEDYSMGYGNAQSLIAFGRYNIPNSVFPIFWWPNNIKNVNRQVLFHRYETWND